MQYEATPTLPAPDADSAAHSRRTAGHLRELIGSGSIAFARYMHEALYAPGLGYYAAGSTKFGAAGDFVTAPEVSSVFGRVLARQCAEILGGIDDGDILEFGAGSGKLAVDLLAALDELGALPRRYCILEVSADLRERQQRRLAAEIPEQFDRIVWLTALPAAFRGVVLANEVLDALPVERFVRRRDVVRQRRVACRGGRFVWESAAAPERLEAAVNDIEASLGQRLADGYESEVCLAMPGWIADIAESLALGAVLVFDYGVTRREYYARDRADGWLRCHFRHHAHNDPLVLPGIQDITAWVDFSAVAQAAVDAGLDILGYQTQSQFLIGGGLDAEMQRLADLSTAERLELSQQVKTLTLPGEMGERFKCIALGQGEVATPSAFHFVDRTPTL